MTIKISHFSKFSNNLGIRSESSQCGVMIRLFRADDHHLDEILFDLIPTWPIINQMNLDLRSRLSLHFTVETIWYFQMASNQKNLLKFADELVKGTDSTDASVTSMDQVYESFERLGLPSRKWSQHPAWWKEKSFTPKDFIIGKFFYSRVFWSHPRSQLDRLRKKMLFLRKLRN